MDLEFPDWSGMHRFGPRLEAGKALQLNEEYGETYGADLRWLQERRKEPKCEVEFIL